MMRTLESSISCYSERKNFTTSCDDGERSRGKLNISLPLFPDGLVSRDIRAISYKVGTTLLSQLAISFAMFDLHSISMSTGSF